MKSQHHHQQQEDHHRHHHHHLWSGLHLPWLLAGEKGMPPRGCVTVRVGAEGEERRRFAVPVEHLGHPLFAALLDEAEKEFGFEQEGPIIIPCRIDHFRHVEGIIGHDMPASGHNHHHHNHHDGHHHLPHFAGCFRA